MKVILKEEVDNLGNAGDLVSVRAGYARNFLFPRSLAVRADERNVAQMQHDKRTMEARRRRLEATAKAYAGSVEKIGRVVMSRACGADGRLFGSVTAMDIAAALGTRGVEVDKRSIVMIEALKHLGDFDVAIKAGQGIKVTLKVSVEADEPSAALMAKQAESTSRG